MSGAMFVTVNEVLDAYDKGLISYKESRSLLGFYNDEREADVKRPVVNITFPTDLSPAAAERLRQLWTKQHAG